MTHGLRIALLTHSTNPRGGVSHALSLAEALIGRGHTAVVHAPDPTGHGFFRHARCPTVSVSAASPAAGIGPMVEQRIGEYTAHFEQARHRGFDIYHAHDGMGGNALADLVDRGLIGSYVQTVHHLNRFTDAALKARQARAVTQAAAVLCVSDLWCGEVKAAFGIDAARVSNGVDTAEFGPDPSTADAAVRARWGLGDGPVMLSVGGCEPRKNTLRIIEAFGLFRRRYATARLMIVGGASVLDHAEYRAQCLEALDAFGLSDGPDGPVVRTGPVPQADMPSLYRAADALVFPSLVEGFGLAVLEALACATPVVVSRIPPFTEYLDDGTVLWADPSDPGSIAEAMARAVRPGTQADLSGRGLKLASRFGWPASADQHLDVYRGLIGSAGHRSREACHA